MFGESWGESWYARVHTAVAGCLAVTGLIGGNSLLEWRCSREINSRVHKRNGKNTIHSYYGKEGDYILAENKSKVANTSLHGDVVMCPLGREP